MKNPLLTKIYKSAGLFAFMLTFFYLPSTVQADESSEVKNIEKLLLSPEQRAKIDAERQNYLRSQEVKDIEGEEIAEIQKPEPEKKVEKKVAKRSVPMKPRVVLPKKVSVSAVIKKSDGTRFIRVNNEFNTSPSRHIKIDYDKSDTKGADLTVGDQPVFVPVGTSYQPSKRRVIDTYKLNPKEPKSDAKQKILKADEESVKRTLKDVKTVNTPKVQE